MKSLQNLENLKGGNGEKTTVNVHLKLWNTWFCMRGNKKWLPKRNPGDRETVLWNIEATFHLTGNVSLLANMFTLPFSHFNLFICISSSPPPPSFFSSVLFFVAFSPSTITKLRDFWRHCRIFFFGDINPCAVFLLFFLNGKLVWFPIKLLDKLIFEKTVKREPCYKLNSFFGLMTPFYGRDKKKSWKSFRIFFSLMITTPT